MVLSKSNESQNLKLRVKILKKNICDRKAPHGEVVGSESLYIQDLRIHGSRIGQIRFSLSSFNFRPCPDFHQKMLKKCKNKSYISFEVEKRYVLILKFLDSSMAEFFLPKFLFCVWFTPSSGGKKVEPRVQILGISHFSKNLSFSKIIKGLFLFFEYYLWWKS